MGADLIAASLLLPRDTKPDWDAAYTVLKYTPHAELTAPEWDEAFVWTDFFELHDDPDTPEVRHEILTNALDTVKDMYTSRWRNTVIHHHKHHTVWILGETSYGEEPVGWTEFNMFCATPLYRAAGFLPLYDAP